MGTEIGSNTNVRCEPKRSTTDRRAYCLLYAAMSYSRGGCRFRSISRPVGVGGAYCCLLYAPRDATDTRTPDRARSLGPFRPDLTETAGTA